LGRKVHPIGFRLGYNKEWFSVWYAEGKQYTEFLHQDLKIRQLIDKELADAEVSRIKIERFPKQINITIHTCKAGVSNRQKRCRDKPASPRAGGAYGAKG
jgi:small subunit ribosomal protein S3